VSLSYHLHCYRCVWTPLSDVGSIVKFKKGARLEALCRSCLAIVLYLFAVPVISIGKPSTSTAGCKTAQKVYVYTAHSKNYAHYSSCVCQISCQYQVGNSLLSNLGLGELPVSGAKEAQGLHVDSLHQVCSHLFHLLGGAVIYLRTSTVSSNRRKAQLKLKLQLASSVRSRVASSSRIQPHQGVQHVKKTVLPQLCPRI
jgi:hypothetical protein